MRVKLMVRLESCRVSSPDIWEPAWRKKKPKQGSLSFFPKPFLKGKTLPNNWQLYNPDKLGGPMVSFWLFVRTRALSHLFRRWRQFHCAADVGPCSVGSFFGIQLLGVGKTDQTGSFCWLLGGPVRVTNPPDALKVGGVWSKWLDNSLLDSLAC